MESLLTQTLIVHIIRTKRVPFFGSRASLPHDADHAGSSWRSACWLPYSPFAADLGMVPLPAVYWAWIAAFLLAYATLTHLVKTWFFKRFGGD